MTVNRERVRLLVDALRSGEFTQATGTLHRTEEDEPEGYCCLGVACVVAMRNGCAVEEVSNNGENIFRATGDAFDESSGYLPKVVVEFYGFDVAPNGDPELDKDGVSNGRAREWLVLTATKVNDQLELDFSEIADAFEYTYLREENEK